MDPLVNVTLTGPAKVGGKREPAGKGVTVSTTVALQLAASGVINPEIAQTLSDALAMPETALASDFDGAVKAAIAEREAHWSTAMDHFETMAEDRQETAVRAVQEEWGGRYADELNRADALEARVLELEQQLAALTTPEPMTHQGTEPGVPAKRPAKAKT